MRSFQFTKWFFDFQVSETAYFVVFISEVRLFSGRMAWFQFQGCKGINSSGTPEQVNFFRRMHPRDSGSGAISFKEGFFETGGGKCSLEFRFPEMEISLRGTFPEMDFSGSNLSFNRGKDGLNWHPLFMNGKMTGFFDLRGDKTEWLGVPGYCDKVVSTILPWRLPVRKLFWGEWTGGEKALTFSVLLNGRNSLVASRIIYRDGLRQYGVDVEKPIVTNYRPNRTLNINFPECYTLLAEGSGITVKFDISGHRILIVSDFLRNVGIPGRLTQWLTGNPKGIKCRATACLEIRTATETLKLDGVTLIDEYVVF